MPLVSLFFLFLKLLLSNLLCIMLYFVIYFNSNQLLYVLNINYHLALRKCLKNVYFKFQISIEIIGVFISQF